MRKSFITLFIIILVSAAPALAGSSSAPTDIVVARSESGHGESAGGESHGGTAEAGAEEHHPSFFNLDLLFFAINFLIFAGALFYFLRKPTKTFFFEREKDIREALGRAEKMREELNEKFEEYETKLKKIGEETDAIVKRAEKEGAVEKEEIIAAGREQADRLIRDANQIAEAEVKNARRRLGEYAIEIALEITEKRLPEKLNDDSRRRLIDDYLDRLEKVGK